MNKYDLKKTEEFYDHNPNPNSEPIISIRKIDNINAYKLT